MLLMWSSRSHADEPSRLTNISTRSLVQTGAQVMIAGFIIGGASPKPVLVRALGPTLGLPPFNVPGALPNPVVTLFSGATAIAQNDGWQNQSDPTCANAGLLCGTAADIQATALATIEDPQVIRTILAHIGLPTEVPVLSPPRSPPARAADLFADMPA
jgi:hypothetical protein